MNIETRIKWTLIGSLVLSFPALRNAWNHQLETTGLGKYYIAALFVSAFFVWIIHKLIVRFTFDLIKAHIERGNIRPARRRADRRVEATAAGEAEVIPEDGATEPAPEELVS